jgi:phosphoglycolate phosphatase-like HAD superfamily hydrolase
MNYNPDLEKVMKWTEAINKEISEKLGKIPPFNNAKEAIHKVSEYADLIVVSQTPYEALLREWQEHDLKKYIKVIAGQEQGTKTEHISIAAKGKYPDDNILMIGDAKGDLDAAKNNSILFFPIFPGKEDESWERFLKEGFKKFISGTFKGVYEESLLNDFEKFLPKTPPWNKPEK